MVLEERLVFCTSHSPSPHDFSTLKQQTKHGQSSYSNIKTYSMLRCVFHHLSFPVIDHKDYISIKRQMIKDTDLLTDVWFAGRLIQLLATSLTPPHLLFPLGVQHFHEQSLGGSRPIDVLVVKVFLSIVSDVVKLGQQVHHFLVLLLWVNGTKRRL